MLPLGEQLGLRPQGAPNEASQGLPAIDSDTQTPQLQPDPTTATALEPTGLPGPSVALGLATPYGKIYFETAIPPSSHIHRFRSLQETVVTLSELPGPNLRDHL